jgi:hypothetical protein
MARLCRAGRVFSFLEAPMTTTFYRHWRDVPESAWRSPNLSPAEIACRGTGKLLINAPARSTGCRRCATGWASR